ncbi:hypothetical protein [Salinicoccus halodurans]|uniref:Antitoxin n=1 Tax=Salinicoccus halodurans TaxID=407035 RepID=A0A0F7HKJ8_9STAP|nr:hypothetical protein [Salinicoccus halodurans]AKG73611.1 hypothetical protein AAT16_04925 [Salinicoccus halodurans]SFK53362.1 hypothetical protein SAMN05216235_0222 [Salinicoccus halodurans]
MAEEKKSLFDKAKDKVNDLKDNTSKEDVQQGWDSAKEQGDKHFEDNEKWNSAKEKGDSAMDKFGGGNDENK